MRSPTVTTCFVTTALNYPRGVNLGTYNTQMPLLGVMAAPLTWIAGPVASLNLLLWLAFPLSATSMFFVLRRWSCRPVAAFTGGLLYGFSPYMVGQSTAHLHLTFVPLPPLIFLCLVELFVRRTGSALRWGLALGLLAAGQFLISSEILVTTGLVAVIGLAVLAVARPADVAPALRVRGSRTHGRRRGRHRPPGLPGLDLLRGSAPLPGVVGGRGRPPPPDGSTRPGRPHQLPTPVTLLLGAVRRHPDRVRRLLRGRQLPRRTPAGARGLPRRAQLGQPVDPLRRGHGRGDVRPRSGLAPECGRAVDRDPDARRPAHPRPAAQLLDPGPDLAGDHVLRRHRRSPRTGVGPRSRPGGRRPRGCRPLPASAGAVVGGGGGGRRDRGILVPTVARPHGGDGPPDLRDVPDGDDRPPGLGGPDLSLSGAGSRPGHGLAGGGVPPLLVARRLRPHPRRPGRARPVPVGPGTPSGPAVPGDRRGWRPLPGGRSGAGHAAADRRVPPVRRPLPRAHRPRRSEGEPGRGGHGGAAPGPRGGAGPGRWARRRTT